MDYSCLSKFKWNNYLLWYSLFNVVGVVLSKQKIAIVGAGIGGTSCAYFLRELCGNNIEIDIFEKSDVGGRLATVKYKSEEYETGGSIIHPRNRYMYDFVRKFGLEQKFPSSDGKLVIANGKQSQFETSKWDLVTMIKCLWRYRFSVFRLRQFINNMLNSFDRIYELQSQLVAFETVHELLAAMDPVFLLYQNISTHEGFKKYAATNDKAILELVQGSLRVNYGQTVTVQMFVGAVSIAGMDGGLWSVKGGNKLTARSCLYNSKANLYNYKVNEIIRNEQKDKFNIVLENDEKTASSGEYDVVVIATPITADSKNGIEFINFSNPIKVNGSYHRTVATIVKGSLKATVLNKKSVDDVDCIINLDEAGLYNSIGKIQPVSGSNSVNDGNLWKIFSQRILTDDEIKTLFDDVQKIDVADWLAYPRYDQLGREDSFILADKLFYINAIEWASSAMEMSALAAKNVALLIFKQLRASQEKDPPLHRTEFR